MSNLKYDYDDDQETSHTIGKLLETAGAFLKSDISFSKAEGIPQPFADCSYIKDSIKACYDQTHNFHQLITTETDGSSHTGLAALNELFINGPDSEIIWQQLEHKYAATVNNTNTTTDVSTLDLLIPLPNTLSQNVDAARLESSEYDSDGIEESLIDESEENKLSDEEEMDESEDEIDEETEYSSHVDDDFFSLKKMEAFLDQQDADYMKDPDGSTKMPELYEPDSDAEDHHYMYSDLFGKTGSKNSKSMQSASEEGEDNNTDRRMRKPYGDSESDGDLDDLEERDDLSDEEVELMKALDEETAEHDLSSELDEEEDDREKEERDSDEDASDAEHLQDIIGKQKNEPSKSEYERRTEKLRDRISAMEEEALSDKPWQLKGEVTAKSRPENSLIQEAVEFDSNVAPVPAITMETTQNLEALIIQRIKDKAFDDVERKTRLKEDGEKFKKRIELDHEKSKQSLSQIYEQEYLKLRDKEEDDEEKEDPEEAAIKRMMTSLFTKLDALSSYHYTPKPAPKEVKIISHLPSIVVEEVQPTTVADAAQLAPEEVKRPRVEVKDRSERDQTDKKRIRRKKKAHNRKVEDVKKKAEARVQKINPGLGNKRAEQRSIEAIKQAVVNEGRVIKPSKESVLPDKTFSSSKEFFKALQTEVKLDKKFTRTKSDLRKKKNMSKPADKLKL